MTEYRFTWDPAKAAANFRKHGITFEDAMNVFKDTLRLTVQDRIEGNEYRWQTIGSYGGIDLLLVAHTESDEEGTVYVRIISARKASTYERKGYEHENGQLYL